LCRDQNENRTAYGEFNDGAGSLPNFLARQDGGRWPANVILDEGAAAMLDAQSARAMGDTGGASRFFFVAKPSRREREAGLREAGLREAEKGVGALRDGGRSDGVIRNIHPTVKPITLARHLATLLLPPPRQGNARKLLVPFSGSGSEVIGALLAGWDDVTGIEREGEYAEIARARIGHAVANPREFEADDEDEDEDAADEALAAE
jgi:site-specific DNA-methyltransferase (adenine-specific)